MEVEAWSPKQRVRGTTGAGAAGGSPHAHDKKHKKHKGNKRFTRGATQEVSQEEMERLYGEKRAAMRQADTKEKVLQLLEDDFLA